MSWYPDAIIKNIPPGSNDPRITPIGVILHSRGGVGDSLYDYFDGPSGGIESHGYIRFGGEFEQYRDTQYEADANYKGNSFFKDGVRYGFLSVETEGYGTESWADAQIDTILDFCQWTQIEHKVLMRECPTPYSSGVGYHIQFGSPGAWTPVAKICPGPIRIEQYRKVIIPTLSRFREDYVDMDLDREYREYWDENGNRILDNRTVSDIIYSTHRAVLRAEKKIEAIYKELKK